MTYRIRRINFDVRTKFCCQTKLRTKKYLLHWICHHFYMVWKLGSKTEILSKK